MPRNLSNLEHIPMHTRNRRQSFKPAIVFSPGVILKEELEARGLGIEYLASSSPTLPEMVQNIIEEKQPITPEIAQELSSILGISSQFWLNLEKNYQDFLASK